MPRSSTVAELDRPGAARSSGHETISSVNKASVLATTRPLGSAIITSSTPVVDCSCATAAGNGEAAVWTGARRTTGFAARYSARASTRRPSSRWKLARVCSTETAETATRTAAMRISCTTTSWEANERGQSLRIAPSLRRPLLLIVAQIARHPAGIAHDHNDQYVHHGQKLTRWRPVRHSRSCDWISPGTPGKDREGTTMFKQLRLGATIVAATALLVTGCGATADRAEPGSATSEEALSGLRFMVPNTAGSGYDTTARAAAKVMDDIQVTKSVEVFNLAGAGGTVGLSRTVSEKGNGKLLMMMGLGVVGAQYTNKSEAKL